MALPQRILPSDLPPDLVAVARTADLLDRAWTVPGTRVPVGVDALVGLIPGAGDVLGGIFSTAVLTAALRHRVPFPVLLRMVANVLLDMGVGSVPVLGDVLDALWMNNVKNVDLLLEHRNTALQPREVPGMVKAVLGGVMTVLVVTTGAISALCAWGAVSLFHAVMG